MKNHFNLSDKKLSVLIIAYKAWLASNPHQAKYPEEFRIQAEKLRSEFLNIEVLNNLSDEVFYDKIFKYSRTLEGPAHIKLGEKRIKESLPELRRCLTYIISSHDSPFAIAQNILDGDYRVEVFAKAFWSPILHARFPGILPNWNNKTERFLKKFGINLSTSKLSISEKYQILSDSFKQLSSLSPGQDFFNINHLMHFGTEIKEGTELIDKLLGDTVSEPVSEGNNQEKLESSNLPLNTILYGPPGTGKTYITQALSVAAVKKTLFDINTEVTDEIKIQFHKFIEEGQIVFCTFHQSIGYEDFIEGIKPLSSASNKSIHYEVVDGIFKKIALEAESNFDLSTEENQGKTSFEEAFEKLKDEWELKKTMKFPMATRGKEYTVTDFGNKSILFKKANGSTTHTLSIKTLRDIYYHNLEIPKGLGIYYTGMAKKLNEHSGNTTEKTDLRNYVLIIDEINRGNIPQIFGELITLIEDDKRKGKTNFLRVTLPYSNDSFSVPPNLYIIGTMNTADRSVESLDTALRRRFSFIEMDPQPNKLNNNVDGIDLTLMLETINARLELLIDKDHTIGHAWLMGASDLKGVKLQFENKIIPLLKEFFYNEYEKIGLVLCENFFTESMEKKITLSGFKPGAEIAAEYRNKQILKLKNTSELTKEDFISIYYQKNNNSLNIDLAHASL